MDTETDSQEQKQSEAGLSSPSEDASEPLKANKCRGHIRKEAAKAWRDIVEKLLEKAKDGSVPHITLVAKLAGFEQGPMAPPAPKRRGKSLAQELREEMEALEARNIAEFGE